ncbi:SWPV1-055 [Shearwaterpox virus]|uniref:SWPV1-055 n=1 Tax=Shearwaterpox virus TaxID=1974596 RepID=A0A1V0S7W8_CNPV|nr:SWPV1-055 [Shearwaterpox virus]
MIHRIFLSFIFITSIIDYTISTLMTGIKYKNFNTSLVEKVNLEGKSSNIIIGEYISNSDAIFNVNDIYSISNDICIYIYLKKDKISRTVLIDIITDKHLRIERNILSSGLWYCFKINNKLIDKIDKVNNVTIKINTDAEVNTNYPPFIEYYTNINNYDDKRNKRAYELCSIRERYLDLKYLDMDDTIIAPRGITFKYCRGYCNENNNYFYSNSLYGIIATKFISLKAVSRSNFRQCCSPESMESISILYMDQEGNIRKGELVDSTISKCVCK